MKVTLLTAELESRHQVDHALKLVSQCYQSTTLTFKKMCKIAKKHRTILELFDVTVLIEGISYASHVHFIRHRHITPFVQSQRYTSANECFNPAEGTEDGCDFNNTVNKMYDCIVDAVNDGLTLTKEEMRYLKPQGIAINMGFKTNMRELLHILALREAPEAMPETREVAKAIRAEVMKNEILKEMLE